MSSSLLSLVYCGSCRCALADGHAAEGETGLKQALEIFQRIGAAEAAEVATELDTLSDHAG